MNLNNLILTIQDPSMTNDVENQLDFINEGSGNSSIFNKFILQMSDVEESKFFSLNFEKEELKFNYSSIITLSNKDYINFYIIIFQLIFFIKNISYKTVFEFRDIFELAKIPIKELRKEFLILAEEDSKFNFFKYALDKLEENQESEILNHLTEIFSIYIKMLDKCPLDFNIMHDKLSMLIHLLFSLVELNEEMYSVYFFTSIYSIQNQEVLINILKNNHTMLSLLVSKYINFIQDGKVKVNIDLINLFENIINLETLPRMKDIGIFPLILSYLMNFNVNFPSLFKVLNIFCENNTMTIVNLLEKIKFSFQLTNYMEGLSILNSGQNIEKLGILKINLVKILPFLR
jgi:hypothetical protein